MMMISLPEELTLFLIDVFGCDRHTEALVREADRRCSSNTSAALQTVSMNKIRRQAAQNLDALQDVLAN